MEPHSATDVFARGTIAGAIDLAERAGARHFKLWSWSSSADVDRWHVEVTWTRNKIIEVSGLSTPVDAATAIAVRMLLHAVCRCGYPTTIHDMEPCRCTWRLTGSRWKPSCKPRKKRRDLVLWKE